MASRKRRQQQSGSAKTNTYTTETDFCSSELRIKRVFNVLGRAYVTLVLLVTLIVTMFFTIPEVVDKLNFIEWKHRLVMSYFIGAAVGNYILAIRTDTSTKSIPESLLNDADIETSLPPRAFPCRLCKAVILKRDHHCFLLGKCIGYHNQKYFVWFCLHMTMGAFYSTFQTALYLSLAHRVQFPGAWTYIVLLPNAVIGWLNHQVGIIELTMTVYLYICLTGGLISLGFFLWEVRISAMGLTTHEAIHGQRIQIKSQSSSGVSENLRDVFGQYWMMGLVLPLPLPQYGNGYMKY